MRKIVNSQSNDNSEMTITSRRIAELTGKRHSNVLRDIRKMMNDLGEDEAKFRSQYKDSKGRALTEYILPKNLTYTLVAGYTAKMRKAVIEDRWEDIEAQAEERDAEQSSRGVSIEPVIQDGELLFSSRMVAEKAGKRHSDVCRDIRNMCEKLNLGERKFASSYFTAQNKEVLEYLLPERYLMNVLLGYSVELRDRVITEVYRLKEENARLKAKPAFELPDFTNPVEAARAWADAVEQKNTAEKVASATTKALEAAQPAIVASETFLNTAKDMNLNVAAKALGWGPHKFNDKLRELGFLFKKQGSKPPMPKAPYVDKGIFTVRWMTFTKPGGEEGSSYTTMVTPKGLLYLADRFYAKGLITTETHKEVKAQMSLPFDYRSAA
ncbi:Rha family transcriptional regulator [Pseudovibrio sp. SPO723]|uniref:Rha family transcriptional regulator n=1 Tax=Nesiotobacter zosterae TaxID=392721 RepID=UPI0029C54567|nr:Rha family transcriptional regulator [Pseudovibrio sp. SPO723]MDX5592595.1 Rha family transcriptional regulator [Pseudovibrio sp. SPO723]